MGIGDMGILSTIFGGGDVIKAGFDLIDDMHTSDVEAIEAKTKAKTDLLTAYAPFKIAQRYMAVLFTINFIVAFWVAVALWSWDKDLQGFLDLMLAFNLGWIMLTIVGFYFGGGAFEGILKAKGKKQ
jgi:hypothetical protein